jgi:ribosomal-protein-serine acetyltransferase
MLLTEDVVVLRPPKPDDAPRLADAVRASLTTLSAWMPWATPDYSAESALEWMVDARVAGRCRS